MTERTTLDKLYRLQALAARISDSARVASGSAQCAAQFMAGREYPNGSGESELTLREKSNVKLFRAALSDLQRYIDLASVDLESLGLAPIKPSSATHPDDIDDEEMNP